MVSRNNELEQELAEVKKRMAEELEYSGICGESKKSVSSVNSEHELLDMEHCNKFTRRSDKVMHVA